MIMGNLKQSPWMITLLETYHAINFVIACFMFLLLVPHVCAQVGDAESSNNFVTGANVRLNPATTIILLGLIALFLILICYSIYGQSCIGTNGTDGLVPIDPDRYPPRGNLHGLDPAVIDTFPTFLYSDVKGLKIGKAVLECAVCLNEFEDKETLRLLPKCCHVFHPECIDTWLVSHVTCPVCRANLVPVLGEENDINILTESTQPSEAQPRVHEISELAIDLYVVSSPEVIELSQSTNQNRPPRSTPKSPIVDGKYPRSHSTGHSLIQPDEDCERFTLRLPTHVQNKLNKPELRRAKSNVAFPTVTSSKKWYRSDSVRTGRQGKSKQGSHEQFDSEDLSAQNLTRNGSLLKSIKLPFERVFVGTEKDDAGERSFARLMGNSPT